MANTDEKHCPIDTAMKYLGKKWTLHLIRDLFSGAKRFKDFLDANPHLSTKMLSARLKELETAKIIAKNVVRTNPLLIEYSLTERGRALNRVLYEVALFAINNCPEENGTTHHKQKVRDHVRTLFIDEKPQAKVNQ